MRRLFLALISFSLAAVLAIPVPASANPENATGVAGGVGELVVSWEDPAVDPAAVEYLVELDQGGAVLEFANVGVGTLTTTFSGLQNNALYNISVTARQIGGLALGTTAMGTGTTATAPPSGASVVLSSPTSSSLVATFSAADGGGVNAYTLTVRTGSAAGPIVQGPTVATSPATISTLGASTEYFVTVSADNGVAPAATATASATTAAPPVVAPSAPAISLGSVTSSSLVATFSAADGGGVNAYTLTVRTGSAAGPIVQGPTVATSPATISTLGASTEYFVTVSADNGVAPAATATASATTAAAPVVPPSAVVVTIGTVTETSIAVSWDSAGDPATYDVSISPAGAPGGLTGSPLKATTFINLNPGIEYTITVSATNAGGGPVGGTGTVSTLVAAPVISTLNVTANGSTAVDVSWSATAGGGTNAYTTAISPAEGTGGVAASAATSTSYTGLTPGQAYTVTLTVTNAGGSDTDNGSATTAAVAATAPGSVTAELGGAFANFVTVRWAAPSNNGGSAITSYVVTLSNGASITVNDPTARSTTFETLAAGTSVTARVQAVTGAGSGTSSAASNSVTTSNVPGQVTGLSGEWSGAANINSIEVVWTSPASNGGLPITGFVVDVSPALDNPIPVVAAGETSLTIGGLDQGTSYTVTVRAQNDRGNSAAVTSSAVLVPSTPGTVTDLVVEQSPPFSSSIILSWLLPAEDGGSPITGYSIIVDDRDPLVVGPTVTTASFSDLPVGDHNVTIRAITAAGLGATVTSPNFEVKAFAPFDTEEAFVTQLYADFLRRTPDAAGLAFWTERVANDGSNVQDIVEAFMRSPEFAPRRSVARLYFAYFNRQPDKSGFDFWTRQISTGAGNLENASQSFAQSQEFADTYGSLSDAEFIVLVYNNVLARRPDQAGFEFWLVALTDGLPRGTMMTLFSESPENIELSRPAVDVTVTYDGLLQRAPDVEGFRFWTGRVSDGDGGLTELIRQFYFSLEYADRVNR